MSSFSYFSLCRFCCTLIPVRDKCLNQNRYGKKCIWAFLSEYIPRYHLELNMSADTMVPSWTELNRTSGLYHTQVTRIVPKEKFFNRITEEAKQKQLVLITGSQAPFQMGDTMNQHKHITANREKNKAYLTTLHVKTYCGLPTCFKSTTIIQHKIWMIQEPF